MKTTSNRIAGDALEEQDNTRGKQQETKRDIRRPGETTGDLCKQQDNITSKKRPG